mmetsp:Transcript_82241/g.228230  ORF Transcript_82241/g.228230 Transcript_82241/m.228230 type:complete len:225 (-) Transcript_82241:83-757(-)
MYVSSKRSTSPCLQCTTSSPTCIAASRGSGTVSAKWAERRGALPKCGFTKPPGDKRMTLEFETVQFRTSGRLPSNVQVWGASSQSSTFHSPWRTIASMCQPPGLAKCSALTAPGARSLQASLGTSKSLPSSTWNSGPCSSKNLTRGKRCFRNSGWWDHTGADGTCGKKTALKLKCNGRVQCPQQSLPKRGLALRPFSSATARASKTSARVWFLRSRRCACAKYA